LKQVSATVIDNYPTPSKPHRSGDRVLLNLHLIRLRCPEIAREARPGQFVMVRCGNDCVLPRPFSIHKVDDDELDLFYAVLEGGKGTSWLSKRTEGENVDIFGPLGNGFLVYPDSRNLLLVAGGVGIAPLYFLAQEALKQGYSVTLLHGASTAANLYPGHLLPAGLEPIPVTEDGTAGKRGMVTDLLPDFAPRADQVFACGPAAMYDEMRKQQSLKSKPVQVSLEVRMGCGLGACYGCSIRTMSGLKQVCKDGPVFALDDLLGDKPDFI